MWRSIVSSAGNQFTTANVNTGMPAFMTPIMQRSNTQSSAGLTESDTSTVYEDSTSVNAQAQVLMTTLQNVIASLVQAGPQKHERDDPFLGSEASDFLAALQNFITSIVNNSNAQKSQQGITRTINLKDLASKPSVQPVDSMNLGAYELGISEITCINFDSFEEESSLQPYVMVERPLRTFGSLNLRSKEGEPWSERTALLNRALTTLRTHVFNDMPMRLLHFTRHEPNSRLEITLLDRTGIYSLLASTLRDKFKAQPLRAPPLTWNTVKRWIPTITMYAILSHTWLRSASGEVTYDDWHKGTFDPARPGYHKLVNFCRAAEEDYGLTLGWMDTVCINKESSTELDESIRSMYKWYQKAAVCVTYLSDTITLAEMDKDTWFTRGWTLQELLAPKCIKFYNARWRTVGKGLSNDKDDLDIQDRIKRATTITPMELISSLLSISISRKMQWAAKREVTRGEDGAYSLMGIFNVSMPIAYGEGAQTAFIRLIKVILSTSKSEVLDIFNWAGDYNTDISALLPSSPHAYLTRYESHLGRTTLNEPLDLTHLGLRIPVLLLPAAPTRFPIQNATYTSKGDYYTTVHIDPISSDRQIPCCYNLLDNEAFNPSVERIALGGPMGKPAFAVLNCGVDETNIFILKTCFAVAVYHSNDDAGMARPLGRINHKIPTKDPIVFQLNHKVRTLHDPREYYVIPKSGLGRHGMQFLTMYL